MNGPPGGFGPRPGQSDPERTPVVCHPRPAPVVMPSVQSKGPPPLPTQRTATPLGGTLAPLGKPTPLARVDTPRPEAPKPSNARVPVPGPEVFTTDEEPTASRATAAVVTRVVRNYLACSPANQRLIEAMALALREVPDAR